MSPIRVDLPGLFARAGGQDRLPGQPSFASVMEDEETQRLKMDTFRKVKPTCVNLLSLVGQPPTPTSAHSRLLASLYTTLNPVPQQAFTPSLINYVLFPLTQILRTNNPQTLPDGFLEAAFRLLELLVRRWKQCEGGIDIRAWEQLWRLAVAATAPRVGVSSAGASAGGQGSGKGKEKESMTGVGSQETILEAEKLIEALLAPEEGVNDDDRYPTSEMRRSWESARSPLMPTLFQTITLILATVSPTPANLPLQRTSLRLLRRCIRFLRGQHTVLASLLPGVVSGVSKLFVAEGNRIKGEVAELAAGVLGEVIGLTLNDGDLRGLGVLKPKVADLSQLAEEWVDPPDGSNEAEPVPTSPSPATSSGKPDPFPPLTVNYLAFTSTQLASAVPPVLQVLQSHASHLARSAGVRLAAGLLLDSNEALPRLVPHALRALLALSRDPLEQVSLDAAAAIEKALGTNLQAEDTLVNILTQSMNALPRFIHSGQDEQVRHLAELISAIADITSRRPSSRNPITDLLGPAGKVERWSWSLLDCLEFGRPAGWSLPKTAGRMAQLGWQTSFVSGVAPLLLDTGHNEGGAAGPSGSSPERAFPALTLRHIDSTTTFKAIQEMLKSLGHAGSDPVLHSVDYFLGFAKSHQRDNAAKAVTAVWVAEQLLDGVATRQIDGDGKVGRATRKMCKEVVRTVLAMEEAEDDTEEDGTPSEPTSGAQHESQELIPVERRQGVHALTTLLDRPTGGNASASRETRRLHVAAQRSLLTCMSLRILSLASRILSSSFRPLLLNVLYSVLSHLASPVDIVRDHAEVALAHIAYHANYASPRNLILDNVDYVINVVSLRLTRARLSPAAPLVLIAMIRLVGSEIVPLVHDVVDEIFDALDDYHGYEALTAGLLAVLSTLVGELRAEVEAVGINEERRAKELESRRIEEPPEPEKDLQKFFTWWSERQEQRRQEMDDIIERVKASREGFKKDLGDDPKGATAAPAGEEAERPATRSEQVCTSILAKSLHFLTHPSAFLRARILRLVADAVPALASTARESDLLPLVDQGWPAILNRLDEEDEPAVVAAAAEVIAQLAEWVGDFMSRRILDHAWPRFSKMLDRQRDKDGRSALARRSATAAGTGPIGTDSQHTSSHRLYAAILRTVKWIAAEVPVNDDLLWAFMLAFRPFLDKRAHVDLQALAMDLYRVLGKRDGDALWTCLSASMGSLQDDRGTWAWLADERQRHGWVLDDNAAKLLAMI